MTGRIQEGGGGAQREREREKGGEKEKRELSPARAWGEALMGQWHMLSISALLAPAIHTRLSPLTFRAIISEVLAAQPLTHRQPSDICLTRGDPQSVKLTTSGAPPRPDVNASAAARDRPARCIGIEEEVILTASMELGRELTPKLAVNGRSHERCGERAYDCVTGVIVASSASLRHAGGRGVPVVQRMQVMTRQHSRCRICRLS